jgi:hypothetical protein
MKINDIQKCNLHGGDYLCIINILYTKEDLEKLGLESVEDIDRYIHEKLNENKA